MKRSQNTRSEIKSPEEQAFPALHAAPVMFAISEFVVDGTINHNARTRHQTSLKLRQYNKLLNVIFITQQGRLFDSFIVIHTPDRHSA